MQFTDVRFIVAFPLAVAAYFIFPKHTRKIWLLVLNLLFIYTWGALSLKIILVEVVISYLAALAKEKILNAKIGKLFALCGGLAVLGLLFYYKYFNFSLKILHRTIGHGFEPINIIAPVGISFYSLQILGYLIDVWRGREKAETNPINYFVFITFFPLILSGPIERPNC